MDATRQILSHLLEADDFDIKDVYQPPEHPEAGRTTVKGYKLGRMKVVEMPLFTFLISYLTPVAYHDKRLGTYYKTSKQWSPTTNGHIHEWMSMIAKTPEWKDNPANWEPSEYNPGGHYVKWPTFHSKTQRQISKLFRELISTMEMKPHMKARLYRVDPRMRSGSKTNRGAPWVSGHLKHHDTGEQGLPRPGDPGFEEFFKDFNPDDPDYHDWQGSGYRSQEPYDPEDPEDERYKRRRR